MHQVIAYVLLCQGYTTSIENAIRPVFFDLRQAGHVVSRKPVAFTTNPFLLPVGLSSQGWVLRTCQRAPTCLPIMPATRKCLQVNPCQVNLHLHIKFRNLLFFFRIRRYIASDAYEQTRQ